MELDEAGSAAIAELALNLRLDKSTLSRTVEGLVRAGLVDRSIHPADRRYLQIRLTGQGKEVVQKIHNGYNRFYQKVFDAVPPEKQAGVIEGFGLFADAIRVTGGEDPSGICFCRPDDGKGES